MRARHPNFPRRHKAAREAERKYPKEDSIVAGRGKVGAKFYSSNGLLKGDERGEMEGWRNGGMEGWREVAGEGICTKPMS